MAPCDTMTPSRIPFTKSPKTRWKYTVWALCLLWLVDLVGGRSYELPNKYPPSFDDWENHLSLDETGAYIVEWAPLPDQIIFRVSARTRGYIGFGLSSNPWMDGADIVVGWVHSGKVYLQDRHGKGNQAPVVDKQQDWSLIGGHENDTHTVLIMSRPYQTCDPHDHPITNDTIHLLWAYHPDNPVDPGSPRPRLHYHGVDRRGSTPVFLLQRSREVSSRNINSDVFQSLHLHPRPKINKEEVLLSWSMVGKTASISSESESVHWCRVFRKPNIRRRHHVVKYEPVITPGNYDHIQHMMVYECIHLHDPSRNNMLELLASGSGSVCANKNMSKFLHVCNHVLVAWTIGSEGVWLPPEAGYPLSENGPSFYILETHYSVPADEILHDSSGIRLVYTPQLRDNEAGVLSVGIDPSWKHLIPPSRSTVVSEGHCVKECLSEVLPDSGINVFGVIFHTHMLGKEVMLRHIRDKVEFEPIAQDKNYDVNYQEYRSLREIRKILKGDHLIGQCIYNSEERTHITLGGLKTREEMCLSYLFYWPRVDLTFCHSRPSLHTVLQSLGVEELEDSQNRITIRKPKELAGKTLKWRLENYDWNKQFDHFQKTTHSGTFNPTCKNRGGTPTPNIEETDYHSPQLDKEWKPDPACERERRKSRHPPTTGEKLTDDLSSSDLMFDDDRHLKPIETVDVDPIRTSDYIMPVIDGDAYHPPKPVDHYPTHHVRPPPEESLNELLEELEEVERDIENEVHSQRNHDLNFSPKRTSHKQSSGVSVVLCSLTLTAITAILPRVL